MRRTRGTTLVELMVSTVIVGVFSGALMGVLTQAQTRTQVAHEKRLILGAVQDEFDLARRQFRSGTLIAGVRTVPHNLNLPYTVTITRTTTPILLTNRLYTVTIDAVWNDGTKIRTGSIQVATKFYNEL